MGRGAFDLMWEEWPARSSDTCPPGRDDLVNLLRVDLPGSPPHALEYEVDGLKRRETTGATVDERGWIWDGKLRIVAETDGAGVITKRFLYAEGVNSPETMVTDADVYTFLKDHLGSVRRVLDGSGAVVERIDYDVWGVPTSWHAAGYSSSLHPFGFAGGLWDAATGLVRFGARDYDPGVGRWTAKDPLGFRGGHGLYNYASSSPLHWVDPSGRIPIIVIYVAAGAIAGAGLAAFRYVYLTHPEDLAAESGLPGPWGGKQDALRHCVGACSLSRDIGGGAATFCGSLNENTNLGSPGPLDQLMDEVNNDVGIKIGTSGDTDCTNGCLDAFSSGELLVVGESTVRAEYNQSRVE